MPLSSKDYKDLLEIIEICYSIPDRNLMFKTLCERLQKLVPLSTAAFIPIDPQTGGPAFSRFSAFNGTDKVILQFCSYYAPLHPMAKKGIPFFINQASKITDIISPSSWQRQNILRTSSLKSPASMRWVLPPWALRETQ
jgi:hypothetical protein